MGAVSECNSVSQKKVQLMRAARTDKGVHALGQVISVKVVFRPNLLRVLNEALPEDIRVFDIQLVTGSFDARMSCESRVYEYIMPTYVFAEGIPPPPSPEMAKWVYEHDVPGPQRAKGHKKERRGGGERDGNLGRELAGDQEANNEDEDDEEDEDDAEEQEVRTRRKVEMDLEESPEVRREREAFRLRAEKLEGIRALFKQYEGTKNFHNFTSGRAPQDKSCKRYMMSVEVEAPRMIAGTEWVTIKIHGQSFMLHQIRKMVGLVVSMTKTNADQHIFQRCFTHEKLHVPIAPGTGLFLSHPMYPAYNKKAVRCLQAPFTLKKAEVR